MSGPAERKQGWAGLGILHPHGAPPGPGAVIEVAPGILWARLPLPMALDHVNIYVLDDGCAWTLIDAGMDWGPARAAWDALLAGPLAAKPVGRVIVTHHHPDHIGLAGWFQARGAEIWASRLGWTLGRMLILDAADRPHPEQVAFRRRAGVGGAALAAYAAEPPFSFALACAPLALGYRALAEGDTLRAAGRDWTVRLGEGHAPEQVTLWSDDIVLAADQILPGISPNIGVYATEPEADPLTGWLDSCTRLRGLGGDPLVLPGHKLPFRGLDFRLGQLIANHAEALSRILAALDRAALTALELFPSLYRREIGKREQGLALAEAVAHLNHLYRRGLVTRDLDADGAWRYRRA